MGSLVRELQKDALSSNVSVTDLVRKAFLVAEKLDLEEFRNWLESEMHGYTTDEIPAYRILRGQLKAYNPYHGWLPIQFENPKSLEEITKCPINSPIGQIEKSVTIDKNSRYEFLISEKAKRALRRGMGASPEIKMFLDLSSAASICDAVKNTILKWSIDLEKKGILGEETTFSEKEKEIAPKISIETIHNFSGTLGTSYGQLTIQENRHIVERANEICELLENIISKIDDLSLSSTNKDKLIEIEKDITKEFKKQNPEPSFIQRRLEDLRQLVVSINANLITSGIIYEVSKYIP